MAAPRYLADEHLLATGLADDGCVCRASYGHVSDKIGQGQGLDQGQGQGLDKQQRFNSDPKLLIISFLK